jgi:hypothetical protein
VNDEDHDYDAEPPDYEYEEPASHYETTDVPGKLSPPLPRLRKDIAGIREPLEVLLKVATAHGDHDGDVVALFDGLDRLITPDRFWSVAHQDLRILKQIKVSVLATAPLAILYEGREIVDRFDRVHHLAALSTDGREQERLQSILLKRGGELLLNEKQMKNLCVASGGVLRDLITLARDSAEEAYIAGSEKVDDSHIASAVTQLGTSYLRGLSTRQRSRLRAIEKNKEFDFEQHQNMELLATRRVLEYSATDFRVHPALMNVLSRLEGSGG